ncbi:MAG: hypothetical protein GYB66_11070 [Chloroflexi bacterium]|nr:hypothetical protein [Chloroflexota bacterium]
MSDLSDTNCGTLDLVWQRPNYQTRWGYLQRNSERERTFKALSAARRNALNLSNFRINKHRYIILSDVHRGNGRPSTDDFVHNHGLYTYALSHYLQHDYRLILNGDIEECWKTNYKAIVEAYENTAFRLEGEFARRGQQHYVRIYGNHDDDWADPAKADRFLSPVIGRKVTVYPGVMLGDRIFIAHGHQGDPHSDRYSWFSRRVVRYLWRPLQSILKLKNNRAAENRLVRHNRERFLHQWARLNSILLIAGHTHRPLFHVSYDTATPAAPHYFNLGACVHTDGITGIEIDEGEIRLVKWQRNQWQNSPERVIFQTGDLSKLLTRL